MWVVTMLGFNMSRFLRRSKFAFVIVLLILSSVSSAGNHALLIGVGEYPSQPLEGPTYDVAALQEVLHERWDFKSSEIKTLVNEQATKNRILTEIDGLYARTKPGDNVFLYFSGHGTSSLDTDIRAPLPTTSGAFIPFDVAGVKTRAELMERLVIGREDLRPRFKEFDDNGRHLFVVIDACYSGNTVRGAFKKNKLPERHLSLNSLVSKSFGSDLDSSEQWKDQDETQDYYPYKNVFYLGASGEHEKAQDIPKRMINDFKTIDNKPHGAFTDTLLQYLYHPSGADQNKDGNVSYAELRQSLQNKMRKRGFSHTPQGLPTIDQDDELLAQRNVFLFSERKSSQTLSSSTELPGKLDSQPVSEYKVEVETSLAADEPLNDNKVESARLNSQPIPNDNEISVFVDPVFGQVANQLAKAPGLKLVGDNFDLGFVPGKSGEILMINKSGDKVSEIERLSAKVFRDSIDYVVWLNALFDNASLAANGLSVEASFTGAGKTSVAVEGESVGLDIRLPKGGHLLILNYEPGGQINVIYPYSAGEAKKIESNSKVLLHNLMRVKKPFGRDFVQVIAFDEMLPEYRQVLELKNFSYDSVFAKKISTLITDRSYKKAVTVLELVTSRSY
jgi:hypothetical protein